MAADGYAFFANPVYPAAYAPGLESLWAVSAVVDGDVTLSAGARSASDYLSVLAPGTVRDAGGNLLGPPESTSYAAGYLSGLLANALSSGCTLNRPALRARTWRWKALPWRTPFRI